MMEYFIFTNYGISLYKIDNEVVYLYDNYNKRWAKSRIGGPPTNPKLLRNGGDNFLRYRRATLEEVMLELL